MNTFMAQLRARVVAWTWRGVKKNVPFSFELTTEDAKVEAQARLDDMNRRLERLANEVKLLQQDTVGANGTKAH